MGLQIVACFPDGWLSSGQISREGAFIQDSFVFYLKIYVSHSFLLVSVMKKKYEKEAAEGEA